MKICYVEDSMKARVDHSKCKEPVGVFQTQFRWSSPRTLVGAPYMARSTPAAVFMRLLLRSGPSLNELLAEDSGEHRSDYVHRYVTYSPQVDAQYYTRCRIKFFLIFTCF